MFPLRFSGLRLGLLGAGRVAAALGLLLSMRQRYAAHSAAPALTLNAPTQPARKPWHSARQPATTA